MNSVNQITVIDVLVCTVNFTRSFSLKASEISTISVLSGRTSCEEVFIFVSFSLLIIVSGRVFCGLPADPESSSPSLNRRGEKNITLSDSIQLKYSYQ